MIQGYFNFTYRIRSIDYNYPGMKHFIVVIMAALFAASAGAQVKQEVIASAGGYNSASGISLSWTLGETIIPTFTSPNLYTDTWISATGHNYCGRGKL